MDVMAMLRKALPSGFTPQGQQSAPLGASDPRMPTMRDQVARAASSPMEPSRNAPKSGGGGGKQDQLGFLGSQMRDRMVALQADKIGRKLVGFKQLDPASPINYNQARTAVFTDPEVAHPDDVWRYMVQTGMVVEPGMNDIDPVTPAMNAVKGYLGMDRIKEEV